MNILSTAYRVSLIAFLLIGSAAFADDRAWPVKGEIDLSSTFCDYRPLHFHGGVDIRTGGKEGRKVYSPVDGYIWRLKHSYIGYGKAVYVKDSQGFIYVFGHLSRFSDKFDKLIKKIQFDKKRYYFDTTYAPGQVPVKQGELIAFSGQTGFGAPHIHFEIRNPQNMPLNPLTHGFALGDSHAPEFKRLAIIYKDSRAIFDDGSRRLILEVSGDKTGARYHLDSPVFIKGPFGMSIDAFDRIRPGGPRLNISRAGLFIDDYLYYEVEYEKYDYAQTAMVDLSYDYYMAVTEDEGWHRLYEPLGKKFDGSKSLYEMGGIFTGRTEFSIGLHTVRIEIFDAAGNQSQLEFKFIYYPFQNLFAVNRESDSTIYLKGRPENEIIGVERVIALGIGGRYNERPLDSTNIEKMMMGDFRITIPAVQKDIKGLRVGAVLENGTVISDNYLPLKPVHGADYVFEYELIDNGLLFHIKSKPPFVLPPRIDITYEDGWVESINSIVVDRGRFAAYYRKFDIRTAIVKVDIVDRVTGLSAESREVEIRPVDDLFPEAVRLKKKDLSLTVPEGAVYAPTYMCILAGRGNYNHVSNICGDVYEIEPATIPLAKNITLAVTLDGRVDKSKAGVYRLNSKRKWKWLDSRVSGDRITAESSLTGTFAVLEDTDSPRIKKIHPGKGKTVKSAYPAIWCTVDEELSGIHDDGNISITLDGEWLIPEYDPETKILKTAPRKALKNGRHELEITASDRVGNERTVYSHFFVNKKK